jgi:hypothetical protein
MEDQKKPSVVSNIWNNWCGLDPQKRSQVADRLGPLGHMLSIAANVHMFAKQGAESLVDTQTQSTADVAPSAEGDSEDVIDVDFEEVKP